jgi:tripartite-type tricarboxylate transporter receptor subunit TctC
MTQGDKTMLNRRNLLALLPRVALLAAAGLGSARSALAQVVQKTSRIVVGFPAGGTTDVFARLLADKLRGSYAPTVIVENKPGAAGRLALMNAGAQEADGSASFMVPCSLMFIYPHVYKKLGYDPVADFTPVAAFAHGDFALSVGPMVPESVKTLADLVAWLKANPKQAFFASPAAGATPHFVGVMFAKAAGIELTHASYRGDAPGVQDLLGGQIACSVNNIGVILPHVKSGRVRVLATSGAKRSRYLPNVPTFAEAGFRDVEAQEWFGVFVPSKVPTGVVDGLAKAIDDVVGTPEAKQKIEEFSFEPQVIKGSAFSALLAKERQRWATVVKASGFQIDE